MVSLDANIIIYSLNKTMSEHDRARSSLFQLIGRNDVVIAEQILVEVYLPIRNSAVFPNPYSSKEAAAPVFARRRIIDTRLALTLRAAGVTDLATRNVKDFADFGFDRVWDSLQ